MNMPSILKGTLPHVLRLVILKGSPKKPGWIEMTGMVLSMEVNFELGDDPVELDGVLYRSTAACYGIFVPELQDDCLIYALDPQAVALAMQDIMSQALLLRHATFNVSHLHRLEGGPHVAILRAPRFKRFL